MTEIVVELVFASDLLLLAAIFWALTLRKRHLAARAAIALTGSMPVLLSALNRQFSLTRLLIFAASALLGTIVGMRGADFGKSQ